MMRAIVVALIVSASVPRLAAADESGDAQRFTRNIESAYRSAWKAWLERPGARS